MNDLTERFKKMNDLCDKIKGMLDDLTNESIELIKQTIEIVDKTKMNDTIDSLDKMFEELSNELE